MCLAFSFQVSEFFIKHVDVDKIKINFSCGSDVGSAVITGLAMVLIIILQATLDDAYTPLHASMMLEYPFIPVVHHAKHHMLHWITVIKTVKCRPSYSMLIENFIVLHFRLRLLPLYGSLTNIGSDTCTPIRQIKTVH